MARALAEYLRIFDEGGTSHHYWQGYYIDATVNVNSQNWQYVQFTGGGYTSGLSGDETNMVISAAATTLVNDAFEEAIANGYLIELSVYEFDTLFGNDQPQLGQELLQRIYGQAVGGSATIASIELQIGSALSPVGAQMPPRTYSTALVGTGCLL